MAITILSLFYFDLFFYFCRKSIMKKLLFAFLTIFLAFPSEAKVYFGGSFNINFDTVKDTYNNGEVIINDKTYQLGFNPKVYWNISEKMQLGGRVGFQYGQMYTGSVFSWDGDINKEEPIVNRAIGWSAAPFFGYKLFQWKIITIWAEVNIFVGQNYNIGKEMRWTEWTKQTQYGFQVLPVVDFDITEKFALQIHFGVISLGWCGTNSTYPDKKSFESTWDIRKGGAMGLLQGFMNYGIGIIRKF